MEKAATDIYTFENLRKGGHGAAHARAGALLRADGGDSPQRAGVQDREVGWEPTMGYVCDRAMLEWKIGKLQEMRLRLQKKQD